MVDQIQLNWEDNSSVQIISSLYMAGSVYSCEEWGEFGETEIPVMIDGNQLYLWFMTDGFPDYAILNQDMEVIAKPGNLDEEFINTTIENALADCGPCDDLAVAGDINGDGIVNVPDVLLTVNMILLGEMEDAADLNGDGSLSMVDIILIVNIILGVAG